MKILHCSDIQGEIPAIIPSEKIDVFILSGNVAPSFKMANLYKSTDRLRQDFIDEERVGQEEWISHHLVPWIKEVNAVINVVVCGNRDYFDTSKYFAHTVWKDGKKEVIDNVIIGMVDGSLPTTNHWHDEVTEDIVKSRLKKLGGDIDILVSHMPPLGVLDTIGQTHVGIETLSRFTRGYAGQSPYFGRLRAHFFGHVPESAGVTSKIVGDTVKREVVFSNAAKRPQIVKL